MVQKTNEQRLLIHLILLQLTTVLDHYKVVDCIWGSSAATSSPGKFFELISDKLKPEMKSINAALGKDTDYYVVFTESLTTLQRASIQNVFDAPTDVWQDLRRLRYGFGEVRNIILHKQAYPENSEIDNVMLAIDILHACMQHGIYPSLSIWNRCDEIIGGDKGKNLCKKLKEHAKSMTPKQKKSINFQLRMTMAKKDQCDKELILKVHAYVRQLKKDTHFDKLCICTEDNNKTSRVLRTCKHIIHEKCLIQYWTINIQNKAFSCPVC